MTLAPIPKAPNSLTVRVCEIQTDISDYREVIADVSEHKETDISEHREVQTDISEHREEIAK
jgi:hypothetical protein